jgi:hypothetical protein
VRTRNFWRPPSWKWLIVAGLLACALFLAVLPAKLFVKKPRLIPRQRLAPVWDGAYAKLVFAWQSDNLGSLTATVTNQPATLLHPQPVEQFEVDLHSGEFILRQTDFFVPDVVPIALIRTYHSWNQAAYAFGMGANHPYDIAPTGTRNPYTFMDLNLEDGREIHFERISEGRGYADAVYEHDDTSSEFYGGQISWNGDGWDMHLHDGSTYLFPEAYNAKNFAQAAAREIDDGRGHRIQLLRGPTGNLNRIISPSGHELDLYYDPNGRIFRAGHGENVLSYKYDSTGHLAKVSKNGRDVYTLEYQQVPVSKGWDGQMMTGVYDANGTRIVQNKYLDARIAEMELADGKVYRFKYHADSREVLETTVEFPDGKVSTFRFSRGRLIPE